MEFLQFVFVLLPLSFLYLFRPFFLRKLHKLPPCPPLSLPVLGHLYLLKKPLHQTVAKISKKYGPIMLLQFGCRPVLVVSSPSAVEECFTKNDVVLANRPRMLAGKELGYNYTTLISGSYSHNWRNLRLIASKEILSAKRIQGFGIERKDEIRQLVKRLAMGMRSEDEWQLVDMKSAFLDMILNVLMTMIGRKRYCGDDSVNLEESRKFKDIVTETFELSGAINIGDFVPALRWLRIDDLENKLKMLHEKRDNFMQDLIDECRKSNGTTLIHVLLSLQEDDPQTYTDEMIKGMMQVLLSAGSDTSAATLEWALSLLVNNPEAIMTAQAEIDNLIGHSRLVDESDLPNLPFLNGIIKETLRMYPAGPMLVPHESSADCTVGGYRVPRGAMLLVNMWAIHNDPKLWDEPMKFKPERFVNFEGSFLWMPFGYGRRRCPGEHMAMRVVGLTLALLIQCFDWARVGQEMVDMTEAPGLTMPKAQPLVAKCRMRLTHKTLLSQLSTM